MNTLLASLFLANTAAPAATAFPPLSDALWQVGLVIFLVILNGIFVAAEFAIVKVRAKALPSRSRA